MKEFALITAGVLAGLSIANLMVNLITKSTVDVHHN